MHIYGHVFTYTHTFIFLNAHFIHMGPLTILKLKSLLKNIDKEHFAKKVSNKKQESCASLVL